MQNRRAAPRVWHTDWLVLRPLARLVREQMALSVKRDTVLVDLGCGDMPYRAAALDLGIDYRGADIGAGADLAIDASGRVALDDGAAGAVLSIQVLEHVRDLDAYCGEAARLLDKDGVLLLSTHGNWLYHPHPEDHRRWTRTGLVHDLEARGFKVETIHAIAGPLATTTLIRLTGFAWFLRRMPFLGPLIAGIVAVVMNLRAAMEDRITPAGLRNDNACIYFVRARKSAPC